MVYSVWQVGGLLCVFQVGGLWVAVGRWFTPRTQLTLNNKIDGHQIN